MGIWYKQIGESICKGPAMTKEALSHSNVQNPKPCTFAKSFGNSRTNWCQEGQEFLC
jgi:hypothetical protein